MPNTPDPVPDDVVMDLPNGGKLTIPGRLIADGFDVDELEFFDLAPRPPLTVHQAIAAVMTDLEAVGKDQRGPAEQGGYPYRGIEAVTGALQKLCGRHGVILWPGARVVDAQPSVGMKAGWFDWRVEVTYNVAGPDGSQLDPPIEVTGIGRDNSDKGVNKAMTQAYKYALLQLFMVADPKDDTDKHGSYDDGRQTQADVDAEAGPRMLGADRTRALHAEIKALPAAAREHLMAAWMAEDPMTGDAFLPVADGKPATRFLLADHESAVRALIADALRATKTAGSAPQEPQEAPADVPATGTAGDTETATEPRLPEVESDADPDDDGTVY